MPVLRFELRSLRLLPGSHHFQSRQETGKAGLATTKRAHHCTTRAGNIDDEREVSCPVFHMMDI